MDPPKVNNGVPVPDDEWVCGSCGAVKLRPDLCPCCYISRDIFTYMLEGDEYKSAVALYESTSLQSTSTSAQIPQNKAVSIPTLHDEETPTEQISKNNRPLRRRPVVVQQVPPKTEVHADICTNPDCDMCCRMRDTTEKKTTPVVTQKLPPQSPRPAMQGWMSPEAAKYPKGSAVVTSAWSRRPQSAIANRRIPKRVLNDDKDDGRFYRPENRTGRPSVDPYQAGSKASKRASRIPLGPSQSDSSSDERQSQSTPATSMGGESKEIRLRVDASAPLSLSFNGDMEGRTLQLVPVENGMADLVIANARGGENSYSRDVKDQKVAYKRSRRPSTTHPSLPASKGDNRPVNRDRISTIASKVLDYVGDAGSKANSSPPAELQGILKPQWSAQDDDTLIHARAQGFNWNQIASKHFPYWSPNACRRRHEMLIEKDPSLRSLLSRRHSITHSNSPEYQAESRPKAISAPSGRLQSLLESPWSAQDDDTLTQARERGFSWNRIASEHFPSKSPNACRHRYGQLLTEDLSLSLKSGLRSVNQYSSEKPDASHFPRPHSLYEYENRFSKQAAYHKLYGQKEDESEDSDESSEEEEEEETYNTWPMPNATSTQSRVNRIPKSNYRLPNADGVYPLEYLNPSEWSIVPEPPSGPRNGSNQGKSRNEDSFDLAGASDASISNFADNIKQTRFKKREAAVRDVRSKSNGRKKGPTNNDGCSPATPLTPFLGIPLPAALTTPITPFAPDIAKAEKDELVAKAHEDARQQAQKEREGLRGEEEGPDLVEDEERRRRSDRKRKGLSTPNEESELSAGVDKKNVSRSPTRESGLQKDDLTAAEQRNRPLHLPTPAGSYFKRRPDQEKGEEMSRLQRNHLRAPLSGNEPKHSMLNDEINMSGQYQCEDLECDKVYLKLDARLEHYKKDHPHLALGFSTRLRRLSSSMSLGLTSDEDVGSAQNVNLVSGPPEISSDVETFEGTESSLDNGSGAQRPSTTKSTGKFVLSQATPPIAEVEVEEYSWDTVDSRQPAGSDPVSKSSSKEMEEMPAQAHHEDLDQTKREFTTGDLEETAHMKKRNMSTRKPAAQPADPVPPLPPWNNTMERTASQDFMHDKFQSWLFNEPLGVLEPSWLDNSNRQQQTLAGLHNSKSPDDLAREISIEEPGNNIGYQTAEEQSHVQQSRREASVERCLGCDEAWKPPPLVTDCCEQEMQASDHNEFGGPTKKLIAHLQARQREVDAMYDRWKWKHSHCVTQDHDENVLPTNRPQFAVPQDGLHNTNHYLEESSWTDDDENTGGDISWIEDDVSVISSYAASVDSIFSGDSLASSASVLSKSSGYSTVQILTATKEVLVILYEDSVLRPLFQSAIENPKIGPDRLQRNFGRLLKLYAEQLGNEAKDRLEYLASRLVRLKATFLAQSIVEKFNSTPRSPSIQVYRSESSDEEEEEEEEENRSRPVDEDSFEDLTVLREFLVSGEAFKTLRSKLNRFVSSKVPPNILDEGVMALGELGPSKSYNTGKGRIKGAERPMTRTWSRWVDDAKLTVDGLLRMSDIHLLKQTSLHLALDAFYLATDDFLITTGLLEPALDEGKVRLRWQCKCGDSLHSDVVELRNGGISELISHMHRTSGAKVHSTPFSHNSSNQRYVQPRPGQWLQNAVTRVLSACGKSSGTTSCLPQHNTSCAATACATAAGGNPAQQDILHLLACMHRSGVRKVLQQDRIEGVTTDRTLLCFLRKQFLRHRGRVLHKLSLKSVKGIFFVKFRLPIGGSVDVRHHNPCCVANPTAQSPCECIPPPPKVEPSPGAEYRCVPGPPATYPPIPPEYLSSLFSCPSDCHKDDTWILDQLPKRTCGELQGKIGQPAEGWGIYYQEGLDRDMITLLVFIIFMFASLLFGVLWSKYQFDMQAAFGVSAYMVAASTIITTMIATRAERMG